VTPGTVTGIAVGSPTRLRYRRTKIVATLGPASTDPDVLRRLVDAGVSMFRLNLSHGDHATHEAAYAQVRAIAGEADRPIAVLADLCGPKIRVGVFPGGPIELREGETVTATTRQVDGEPGLIPSQYEHLHRDVEVGCRVMLADGLMELRVESIDGQDVTCTVVHGGMLSDRKGINLPDVEVSAPALTPKDREDAVFAERLGVDYIALSFVRRAADIEQLRSLLTRDIPIVAKIEKPEALASIDEILRAADAIMVARGDLGVELPPETVPIVQQQLIARARRLERPAIVATQMLESMIQNPQPTRAEVSDVSTAVLSGADAVMLSAETAAGAHPVRAVETMDRICHEIESHLWSAGGFAFPQVASGGGDAPTEAPLGLGFARAVAQLSRELQVRAVVAFTVAGATAATLSASRPAAPLVGVTDDPATARRLNLLWGVVPVATAPGDRDDEPRLARELALELGLAQPGQRILTVAGLGGGATAPTISVLTV
jgi:pyruvate kinase